jgi:hypothetical protein
LSLLEWLMNTFAATTQTGQKSLLLFNALPQTGQARLPSVFTAPKG